MGKGYKRGKRRGTVGKYVQLPEWVQKTEAWATMKPGPRALYIEVKRRFNGSNNGDIRLSHREAAELLNVHRNTVGPYFDELEERGFIRPAQRHCLGPSGIGMTTRWALDELPNADGKEPLKGFARWSEKQNPRTKNRTPRHNGCDTRKVNGQVPGKVSQNL